LAALLPLLLPAPHAAGADATYEHRVVVSTTSLDTEREVETSLERNVNRLAAAGYELTAIVGGHGPVLDLLLERKPYVAGLVDHGGHAVVVMARAAGRAAQPREYRLLHVRGHSGVGAIVEQLGASGHRLAAFSHEGGYLHAAFERTGEPVEYRVYANKGRTSWMQQVAGDAGALGRLTRVVPMTLDSALVELGPATGTPGALEWLTVKAHVFSSSGARLREKTGAGFRVQLVRLRGSDVDVLLVKPSGGPAPASYELEDGPWGMPCGRGAIAGADVFTDGDTYCATERAERAVTNQGLDLRVRAEPRAGGRVLFDVPGCEARAALGSPRTAARRLVVAAQLERAINTGIGAGFRATRALAGADESGAMRVTVFTTHDGRSEPPASAQPYPSPSLWPDRDELLGTRDAALEDVLREALTRETDIPGALLWVEVSGRGPQGQVRLAGCTQRESDKATAEAILRRLLVRTPASDAAVVNDIMVDPWR
jgi:hypothetical protein